MDFPMVEVNTTKAKLGMTSSRPPIQINQREADISMEQKFMDTVNISTEAVEVNIDQSEAFADAGLIPPLERTKQFASKAEQTASEFVAKTAREGEQMKSIDENGGGGKVIASIAKENTRLIELETEMTTIPESADKVKFDVDPGSITFDVEKAQFNMDVQPHEPEFQVPRWEVQHYMRQKPSIEFNVVGGQVDRAL
ncbi:hypothetical protein J2S78_000624 [Salibacterium salarium]|uniref:DUF6470 family protein n=1 Tax=Salibacterium salarium TaxID=284579 RepID=UPI00277F9D8A|nr:DUF6470 family protein [Salibacterium salarium]MDQ0298216.1 hypothetical protein [Salibacterium salarium]